MDLVTSDRRELERIFKLPLPQYFSHGEVNTILSAATTELRAYVLVNALWKTGARISELLGMKKGDLDPYNKTIRIRTLKQGEGRQVYKGAGRKAKGTKKIRSVERVLVIPDDLIVNMMSWLHAEKNGSEGLIFGFSRTTAFRIVREACYSAGFRDSRAHPHTFRHSYAVHLLMQGVPITILKDLLGHSSISNTLIYLRITQPDIRSILAQVNW